MSILRNIPNKELVLLLLAMVAFFSVFANRYLTTANIENILAGYSFLAILAIGQSLTIMVRGLDLSIGSNVALGAMVLFDLTMIFEMPGYQTVPLAVLVSTLAGVLNGALIVLLRLQPFVATLATLAIYRGMVFAISGRHLYPELSSKAITDPWVRVFGEFVDIGGILHLHSIIALPWIPVSFLVLLVFAGAMQFFMFKTRWGINLRTVGGNSEAAHLAGLKINGILISVYAVCGLSAGLAAVILVGRFTTATEALGSGMELTAIAAAVIGGTRLQGGIGGIFGPVLGAFLLGIILTGLTLMGISQFVQQVLTGVILVAAVSYDQFASTRTKAKQKDKLS